MKYTIGAFADLLGLTPDILRLYEKYGIVSPVKDESNGYRYYNDLDVRTLLICRLYRSLDIPLQQAVDLTLFADLETIKSELETQQAHLEAERARLDRLIAVLGQTNQNLNQIHDDCERTFQCVESPGLYRLKQTLGNKLIHSKALEACTAVWMQALPEVWYTFRTTLEAPEALDWGMALTEDRFHALGMSSEGCVEYMEPSWAVRSFFFMNKSETAYLEAIREVTDFAKEHHLVPRGTVWGRIVANSKSMGSWIEIYLPVFLTE